MNNHRRSPWFFHGLGLLAATALSLSCAGVASDPNAGDDDVTGAGGGGTVTGAGGTGVGAGAGGAPAGTGVGGAGVGGRGGSAAIGGAGGRGAAGGTGGGGAGPGESGGVIVAGAPYVLYTDLVAGPTTGGENNKGVYLSVFGTNFGATGLGTTVKVFINEMEVDNYRYLGPSHGRPDIQQISVQVGTLGNPAPGSALAIKVVVNGVASNMNNTFTVQPGDILFVSTTGNDSTGVKNDITHPWRHVQTSSGGGAMGSLSPGDVVVLRGGPGVTWSDVGVENRWFRFRSSTGNAPTGVKGHGYLSFIAYPGEDVHYVPPASTNGGIHGVTGNAQVSDWVVISGLHIESVASSSSDGAPINLQAGSDHWRVVNNDLGPWPASSSAADKAGGLVGNGKTLAFLGNHIHDIGGGTLNHGVYLDSSSTDVEVAYNSIHDVTSGNLIQTFDNLGGQPLNGISVHHNILYAGGRYGLNISTGSHVYRAWNNVIYRTALAGVRFSVQSDSTMSLAIVHNTIFQSGSNAPITGDSSLNSGTVIIAHNIVAADPSSRPSSYFGGSGGSAFKVQRNLWFGLGGSAPSQDSSPVSGASDPRFVNAAGHDFSLGSGSAAIDQATTVLPFIVGDDYRGKPRPSGVRADIGAYEF